MAFIGLAAGPATAPLVVTRPLVMAFSASRGLALALGMGGAVAISTVALPSLQDVIAHFGWRAGYPAMAPVTLLFGPAAFFLLQGTTPTPASDSRGASPDLAGHTLREALGDSRFWLLSVSMICISAASGAVSGQFQPLLSDLGVPGRTAALLGAWFAPSVIVGRLGANSTRSWARIPRQGGQGFHGIVGAR
jgi:hypothetical protein